MSDAVLGPDEPVRGRPFADPGRTVEDVAILERIRAALRARLERHEGSGTWIDELGDEHLLVAPVPELLLARDACVAVGFFGQARADLDHRPIVRLEHALLRRAAAFDGLLAYHNVELAERGQWGNLVLFATHDDPAHVAADAEHRVAIDLTGRHYHSLRLHRFELAGGPLGRAPLTWVRTTYLAFDEGDAPWRAMRYAAGG